MPNYPVDFNSILKKAFAGYELTRISTNATTQVLTGAGIFVGIVINTKGASSNTCVVYDDTSGTSNQQLNLDTTSALGNLWYFTPMTNGIKVVTATGTAADLSVLYIPA